MAAVRLGPFCIAPPDSVLYSHTRSYLDTMTHVATPVKRLTRQEQQERTRVALLDASIALFIERGIEATTIEDVVAAAGFTRGAFYSNFESKEELFIEAC